MKEDCPKQLVQTQATPTTVKQILPRPMLPDVDVSEEEESVNE